MEVEVEGSGGGGGSAARGEVTGHLLVAPSEGKEEEEKENGEKEAYRTGIWFFWEMTPGAVSVWCFCLVRQWLHACVIFRRLFGRISRVFYVKWTSDPVPWYPAVTSGVYAFEEYRTTGLFREMTEVPQEYRHWVFWETTS